MLSSMSPHAHAVCSPEAATGMIQGHEHGHGQVQMAVTRMRCGAGHGKPYGLVGPTQHMPHANDHPHVHEGRIRRPLLLLLRMMTEQSIARDVEVQLYSGDIATCERIERTAA